MIKINLPEQLPFSFPAWPFPTSTKPNKLDEQMAEACNVTEEDSLLEEAKASLKFVYVKGVGGYRYVFAYRPAVVGNRAEFVDLAVATCSPNDQYIKRVGKDLAVSRMLNGNYVTLPLAYFGVNDVPSVLHGMFGEGLL
jgi:hypothetical protein